MGTTVTFAEGPADLVVAGATEPGQWADLLVPDCDDVNLAVLQAPAVHATIRRGRLLPSWQPRPVPSASLTAG